MAREVWFHHRTPFRLDQKNQGKISQQFDEEMAYGGQLGGDLFETKECHKRHANCSAFHDHTLVEAAGAPAEGMKNTLA